MEQLSFTRYGRGYYRLCILGLNIFKEYTEIYILFMLE